LPAWADAANDGSPRAQEVRAALKRLRERTAGLPVDQVLATTLNSGTRPRAASPW